MDEPPDRRYIEPEASEMKTRLYLCEGYCPLTGPIRDMIHAAGYSDARTKFFQKHHLRATQITLEK